MENAIKGIMIAVAVIISCLIISMAIYTAQQGQDAGSAMAQNINSVTAAINNNEVNEYTMDEVTGADVVNFIRKYHEDLEVYTLQRSRTTSAGTAWQGTNILTGDNPLALNYNAIAWNEDNPVSTVSLTDGVNAFDFSVLNYAGGTYALTDDNFTQNVPGTTLYINPNNKYRGYTIKNDNDVTTGIYFVQQDDVQVAIAPGSGNKDTYSSVSGGSSGTSSGSVDDTVLISMSQTINSIATAVTKLSDEVASIKTGMYEQQGTSGSTSTDVTVDTSELETQIGALSAQYAELTTALTEVKNALSTSGSGASSDSDVSSQVQENTESIEAMSTKIDAITTKLNEIQAQLSTLSTIISVEAEQPSTVTSPSAVTSGSAVTDTTSTVSGGATSGGKTVTVDGVTYTVGDDEDDDDYVSSEDYLNELQSLQRVNAQLMSVSSMIIDVAEDVGSSDAAKLASSVKSVQTQLTEARNVTTKLGAVYE